MTRRSHQILRLALLAGVAAALAGCDTIRDAAGITKNAPDEFAVATKAPLIIPPEFNLRPPKPGAAPLNQLAATQSAQSALFSGDASSVASTISGNYSQGEKLLLAYAGAANADPSIRQVLAGDNSAMQGADDEFTNQVLFWQPAHADQGAGVDADAEAKRIEAQKQAGKSEDNKAAPDSATIKKEEKSGWFDDIF